MLKTILSNDILPIGRRTKIIATLGPASRSPENIRALIEAGTNVFRLNFSHGSHEEHLESLQRVREVSTEMGAYVAILQDLSGPKIRISEVDDGGFATVPDGSIIELLPSDGSKSTAEKIFVESLNPITTLKKGQHALLADGMITLLAESVGKKSVVCRVVKGGRIRSRVGIAFPDSKVNLPATTKKDEVDLEWGITHGVDYLAISFVNEAEDIIRVRKLVEKHGGDTKIIAKIERRVAVENIDSILSVSDGMMVARGDLGVELPLEKVPLVQKLLIEHANYRGIPAIVATQMLQSMVTSLRPTRAEVSDVATAVMQGADAVMLSEETTIGENPIECVRYLNRIAGEAEKSFEFDEYKLRLRESDRATVPDAVGYAACAAAIKVGASAIIACTETGNTARLVGKYRPQQPLYGVSHREATLRRMALYWGVIPVACPITKTHDEEAHLALNTVKKKFNFPPGTRSVITGGKSVGRPGSTSILEIREV